LAHESDRNLFADFKDFADVINGWLAEEYTASRFRLQDLPAGDRSLNVDYSHGPLLGRSFAIYYNQTRVGRLEIAPNYMGYTTENPGVITNIRIDWARLLGFRELAEFLNVVAWRVVGNSQSDEYRNARQDMLHGLTRTLWDNYQVTQYDHADDEQWGELGELNVSFRGMAFTYLAERDALARARSRS
jgi:hypothetical protein